MIAICIVTKSDQAASQTKILSLKTDLHNDQPKREVQKQHIAPRHQFMESESINDNNKEDHAKFKPKSQMRVIKYLVHTEL